MRLGVSRFDGSSMKSPHSTNVTDDHMIRGRESIGSLFVRRSAQAMPKSDHNIPTWMLGRNGDEYWRMRVRPSSNHILCNSHFDFFVVSKMAHSWCISDQTVQVGRSIL